MRWYAVYRKSDGSLYSTGTSVTAETLPGDLDFVEIETETQPDARGWNPGELAFTTPIPPDPRPLAAADFYDRFTGAERAAIRKLIRNGDEIAEDLYETLKLKPSVDLESPRLAAALAYLAGAGALAADRVPELLA